MENFYKKLFRVEVGLNENLYESNLDNPQILLENKNQTNESHKKFPVIIFSHGISGTRQFYTIYCASLASYGYVVVALEHR